MKWFRMYNDAPNNSKLKLLAFEDRWHFVVVCCMKSSGLLDTKKDELRERRIAAELGLTLREAEEVKRRLQEVDLIEKNWQPKKWDDRQYKHDSSAERTRKYRENKKKTKRHGDNDVTSHESHSNVTVTGTDTDTDTEKEYMSEVYDFWTSTLGKPKQTKFTNDRKAKVKARLREGYSVDDLKAAIVGCSKSEFHQGKNDNGVCYDDLTLICRSGSKVEQFKEMAVTPTQSAVGSDWGEVL